MGAPRRVIALPSDAKQRQRLVEISRSRTEPTSRVERARIILAYLEDPSAYAVARTIGVTQQTVTRCLERAAELGVIEALDDRPRAGRDPVITAEAKTWRVALACRKAKELGYPHELWTARLLAAHARQHGPSAGRSSRSTIAARTWVSRSIGAASRTLEDVRLSVHGAPLSLDAEWLPAVEQFGEGLFIHFNEAAVRTWLEQEPVNTRAAQLLAGFDLWERQHQTHLDYPGAAYTMLHGLSHALMAEIALECGYPASALKERVYALSGHAGPGAARRYGVLIYTATAGNQGTLGGLVATAPNFARIFRSALRRLEVCSNDPICSDHEPTSTTDDRALHGAACHGCLLIAETSCEARNLFLDRALLVQTMTAQRSNFFDQQPT